MLGESISLLVAVLWTTGALFGELASKRLGALQLNVIRMMLSLIMLGTALWFMVGHPYPYLADGQTWLWMALSGFMGFGFGDYFLFNSYILIGSRFSQLFMTLASPFAALTAWLLLGERMSGLATLGMIICIVGIGMSILSKKGTDAPTDDEKQKTRRNPGPSHIVFKPLHLGTKLPAKGIIFGIGAALGQGVGLVLSKVGLEHYTAAATFSGAIGTFVYPVGGTMIRVSTGLLCFLLLLLLKGKASRLKTAVQDRRGMKYAFWATLLGPTVGVSLSLLAIQYAKAGVAQTIMSLTPILIIWPSHVLFKTKVTSLEIVGAIIAVIGVTLFFI